ncbi:uncharacterized protein PAC_10146 [Phialocephala subalpina]|uniref:Uncharacterized protein n=1 Tax=Phialocephala subalpina TaxID=576137 RepID=A0A1L7X5E7_9HELO|nr:uncharacterized protein PAC_10146 [Phialocephala subalpina]
MESSIATITQAPALRERAVNSFCGYWLFPYDATTGYTGIFSSISLSATINALKFGHTGVQLERNAPLTNLQQGSKTVNKQFDGGAMIDNYCENIARTDLPSIMHVMTSFGGNSVQLLLWGDDPGTKPPAAAVSNTAQNTAYNTSPGPVQSTPTSDSNSLSSTDSSNQFTVGGLLTTLPSPTKMSSSSTSTLSSTLTPSSTSGSSPSQDKLNIGAEVGSIIGAAFGLVVIIIAIYYGHRQLREWKPIRGGSARARPVQDNRI